MKNKDILKDVVQYCLGEVDLDTLNKISETISLTAQREKGRLSPSQVDILDITMEEWSNSRKTPREFKGIFRGVK